MSSSLNNASVDDRTSREVYEIEVGMSDILLTTPDSPKTYEGSSSSAESSDSRGGRTNTPKPNMPRAAGSTTTQQTPPRNIEGTVVSPHASSPRPQYSYTIGRTYSSPSVIDASPKYQKPKAKQLPLRATSGGVGPGGEPPFAQYPSIATTSPRSRAYSGGANTALPTSNGRGARTSNGRGSRVSNGRANLTPIARNTSGERVQSFGADRQMVADLSMPETNCFRRDLNPVPIRSSDNGERARVYGVSNMIRPRSRVVGSSLINPASPIGDSDHVRPISPPSRASTLRTTDAQLLGSNTHAHREESPAASREQRYSSPFENRVKLDRNYHTFTSAAEYNNTTTPNSTTTTEGSTPRPASPESPLVMQYQPSRDSSLTSFGLVDDLDSIFLPGRKSSESTKNKSSKGQEKYAFRYCEEDDASSDVFETSSHSSVPSIRLAENLQSSTQDSGTDVSVIEEEEEIFEEEVYQDENHAPIFMPAYNHNPQLSQSRQSSRNRSRHSSRSRSRCQRHLSPKEEREAYEWLRNIEVDPDNNEYVAEAASSKFLRMGTISPSVAAAAADAAEKEMDNAAAAAVAPIRQSFRIREQNYTFRDVDPSPSTQQTTSTTASQPTTKPAQNTTVRPPYLGMLSHRRGPAKERRTLLSSHHL